MRALRATLVIPALFALTSEVLGNLQMATFAAFGGFATLVMVGFGGSRRDKLVAHLVMALAGSVLLVIGTAASSTAALAAAVTLPVVFCVLFAGIIGPNVASASTALLLIYVLPAASPGTLEMIPARLAGWWLASVAGTVAVLVLAPRPAGDRLRSAAAASATALADELQAALGGSLTAAHTKAAVAAKHALMTAFTSAPYRPTGLAVTDQALANLIEDLEWCAALIDDTVREGTDLTAIAAIDQRLLGEAAGVLRDTARVLEGAGARPRLDELEESARDASIAALSHGDSPTEFGGACLLPLAHGGRGRSYRRHRRPDRGATSGSRSCRGRAGAVAWLSRHPARARRAQRVGRHRSPTGERQRQPAIGLVTELRPRRAGAGRRRGHR